MKCIILNFSILLQVPRSSLPISPIHGPAKNKLKKAVKMPEKPEEVTDLENKSKAEDEADTTQSCDSVTATPRLK